MAVDKASGCPFCELVASGAWDADQIDIGSAVVYRIEPLNPVVPGHMLFVPQEHVASASEDHDITGRVFGAAARWASYQDPAYNLITSAGSAATQTVPHLHVHYVPRCHGDGLHLPWTGQLMNGANDAD
jgi:diadenosine tetraphosphate (Ap4A) HIT family hydrolase